MRKVQKAALAEQVKIEGPSSVLCPIPYVAGSADSWASASGK